MTPEGMRNSRRWFRHTHRIAYINMCLFFFFPFADRTAEDTTGNRMGGGDALQRAPGWDSNPGPKYKPQYMGSYFVDSWIYELSSEQQRTQVKCNCGQDQYHNMISLRLFLCLYVPSVCWSRSTLIDWLKNPTYMQIKMRILSCECVEELSTLLGTCWLCWWGQYVNDSYICRLSRRTEKQIEQEDKAQLPTSLLHFASSSEILLMRVNMRRISNLTEKFAGYIQTCAHSFWRFPRTFLLYQIFLSAFHFHPDIHIHLYAGF